MSTKRIYFACRDIKNAGDMIGLYLYRAITGQDGEWSNNFSAKHFIICGSILQECSNRSIVLGAGFGAIDQKLTTKPKLLIVRGKLTENKLLEQGFAKTWELGDPGLMLPFVYAPTTNKTHKLGIVPHYADRHLITNNSMYKLIDICQPVEHVINAIVECEAILTSSLHGLIIAHAYKVPALWVEFSDNVLGSGFKFRDYYSTVPELVPYGPIDCRNGIPKDIQVPPYVPTINKFRKAFNIMKTAVKSN